MNIIRKRERHNDGLIDNATHTHTQFTYRLMLLHLKYTLLVLTLRWIIVHVLYSDYNLHGWIHIVAMAISCHHYKDVLVEN